MKREHNYRENLDLIVAHISQVRASVVLLLLIVWHYEVLYLGNLHWHKLYTKFSENLSNGGEV